MTRKTSRQGNKFMSKIVPPFTFGKLLSPLNVIPHH